MSLQLLKIKEQGLNIICLAVAIFFFSLSFNLFQEPNGLVTGGVTGIVLVLHELFGVKISFATLLINLSFLALGLIFLGRSFFFKTVLGSIVFYPLFLEYLPNMQVSSDLLVNAVLGGILMGIGIVFLYISGGSSGGTSLLARITTKYIRIPFSIAIFFFDGTIILIGFIVFGIDTGVYALIFVFTSTFIANFFEEKLSTVNQLIIDSTDARIREYFVADTGCTIIECIERSPVYICKVAGRDTKKVKQEILSIDSSASILITQIKE